MRERWVAGGVRGAGLRRTAGEGACDWGTPEAQLRREVRVLGCSAGAANGLSNDAATR